VDASGCGIYWRDNEDTHIAFPAKSASGVLIGRVEVRIILMKFMQSRPHN